MEPQVFYARTTDDVTIACGVVGSGPTLVLLPGVSFSNFIEEWQIPLLRGVYERLATRLQIVQYDGRGTGHSQRDVADLSLEAMLRDLDAVAGQAGIDRFALLGFYNSCTHAIAYAALHPERVTRLILFGGSARGWLAMSAPETQALLSLIERDWGVFVESAAHAWMGWSVGEAGRLAADAFRNATTPAVARATFQAASGIDSASRSRPSRLSVRRAYIVSRKPPRADEARLSSKKRREEEPDGGSSGLASGERVPIRASLHRSRRQSHPLCGRGRRPGNAL